MNLLLFQKKRLSKGISLALDFMGGTLDSRISFSRGSNATVVGSNGLIQYAPHNLLTYSEQFDNVAWGKTRATITANATTAPDGTTTADKLIDDGATVGQGYISQNATYTNIPYSFSFYAKAGEVSAVRCYIVDSVGIISASNAIIDLISGTVTSGSANVVSIGNGWWRITVIGTPTAGSGSVRILLPTDTATTNGFYIWGAQLNEGALQPYYTTTVKNLLGYSQNFGNAAWTKSNSSIAASTVIGPFGFDGGEKLVENTVNAAHGVNIDVTASPTTKYTVSSYIKAGERTWARIALIDNLGIDGGRAWFDLVNGVVGNVDVQGAGSNITASIVAVGNGWYRCSVSGQMNNSKTTLTSQIRLARSNGDISYIGDGTSGIYIFGAQLSDSASLDTYSYNPVAAPTSTAYYGPRFDYDPETLAPKGLLIEEQRTNLLLYSEDLSTVWNLGTGTVQSNTWTAPTGNLTGDIFTIGSDSTTPSQSTTITASATYTLSFFVNKPLTTAAFLRLRFGTAAGSISAFVDTSTMSFGVVQAGIVANYIKQIQNNIYQVSVRFTYGATDGGSRSLAISGVVANNSSVPDTGKNIAIWGIQYELGAFPTSYIPTTSATVTRAADNASMVGSNFSSWYNQSGGTLVVNGDTVSNSGNRVYFDVGANGAFGTTAYTVQTSTYVGLLPGAAPVNMTSTVTTTALTNKIATAMQNNNSIIAVNASLGVVDAACTMPASATTLTVGGTQFGGTFGNYLNGHIQSIKYYPTRLPNADLQRLTR
jgi:hypothetical protein